MPSPFKIPASCDEGAWDETRWTRPGDSWPDGHPKPRTCSFCGSVHPEDLMGLLRAGWELENSTKGYKHYINPPGYAKHVASIHADFEGHMAGRLPTFVSATPPVKLYSNHVSVEHAAEINSIILINKAKATK